MRLWTAVTRLDRQLWSVYYKCCSQIGVVSSEVLVNTNPELVDIYSFYTGGLTMYIVQYSLALLCMQERMGGQCTAVYPRGTISTTMTGGLTRALTGSSLLTTTRLR